MPKNFFALVIIKMDIAVCATSKLWSRCLVAGVCATISEHNTIRIRGLYRYLPTIFFYWYWFTHRMSHYYMPQFTGWFLDIKQTLKLRMNMHPEGHP
jgi:hypothetical protein